MRRSGIVAAAVLAIVVMAACSSSSTTATTTHSTAGSTTTRAAATTTRAAATTTAGPTTTVANSDIAIAVAAALNENDLPGFKSVAVPAPSQAEIASARELARCLGVSQSFIDPDPQGAVRHQFLNGNISILNQVHVFASAADIEARYGAYSKPNAAACIAADFQSELGAHITDSSVVLGAVAAERLTVPLRGADRSFAFRVTAPLNTPQASVSNYYDIVTAWRGRVVVILETATSGQPYGADADATLTNKVLSRLPST